MNTSPAAPWVRLGFIAILALICTLSPTMPLPLKLMGLALLVLPLALTLLKWHAARRVQQPPRDDAGTE
ncbi:hypothetical protein IFU30_02850 [Plantibacter sp. CFBP 8798]|uniref:hypothetical protein n=1 Tax=Plantibacter sp. CFBP 8798 TaxID=2775268 RepID=UPI001785EF1B|nr:hypothetical protein [Plantibacter sp. CFBP 8798]MBD8465197.1 hypothetical protein [Plantibacter sp. CFBP 8798]